MSSQSTSLREECRALDESSEFISWFRRHFPTVPSEVIKAFEGEIFLELFLSLWINTLIAGNVQAIRGTIILAREISRQKLHEIRNSIWLIKCFVEIRRFYLAILRSLFLHCFHSCKFQS